MSRGRKISLIYGAGLSTGLVFWGLIAASGMGAVLQSSLYLLMTLKVLGGLYLLWLAWQSARAARQKTQQSVNIPDGKRWFLRGMFLNLSNPKSVIAWMAALSVGLEANDSISAVVMATLVCIAIGFLNNALYSLLFSVGGMMKGYQRFAQKINAVVAFLFAMAGFALLRSAIQD